ncbi:M20/M25/M40 family metallo-hydrolase [Flavilitoribacter nigricans]|uniref:Peptidase M28 n=1 Tax=Flavilitoribacter nigricans (strain ATCC 23147 / DSM 23189 / NBRC 102662 / NCIMB 1420 / SS-2) TaxID=1122177 RepID=A0A2D0NBA0_FLAN2|nr:M20/M25/M40 family metallo-hydrolase [Flavilitoribacter nigricans]PHN05765.1 peptidase M28 [Flavilitoribacter nigricans DSM 23189 = NBRC 102662]
MKNFLIVILIIGGALQFSSAQSGKAQLPEFQLEKSDIEAQLRFIASDELMGRRTGSIGNNIAARFIAAELEALGYRSPEGADDYFQKINFAASRPPREGSLRLGDKDFALGEDLILLDGEKKTVKAPAVYAEYGWIDEAAGRNDYADLDVKGKVVIILSGLPDSNDPSEVFAAMSTKRKLAADRGAVALIEVYTLSYPWTFFRNYFSRERIEPSAGENKDGLIYAWIQVTDRSDIEALKNGKSLSVELESGNGTYKSMASQNVIGVLEGTDPKLKEEYILLTAHYDHVGTGRQGGGAFGPQDSIFNGARDNGIGVVAILGAAKALAKQRPKRSVIILAVTAEEIGLLGSQYYAAHPLIPLEKTIFNLNSDGAGYTNTEAAGIIGWDRTGTNKSVEQGLAAFGLEVIPEPAREQGLFDRSDNVSFAREGVPCLTFSPGFETFNQELMKNYHQVTDEADTVDFDYVQKFVQAFAHTARLIADADKRPVWVAGDKYEAAGKALYEKK